MIEQIKYINHLNEVVEFGKAGIFANSNDLHDFAWSYKAKNDKLSYFKKGVVKKTIPVLIKTNTDAEGIAARNKLFEIAEKDVLTMNPGKLIIGNYYLKCYITASKKKNYLPNRLYMQATLTVSTDSPFWVKETTTAYGYEIPVEPVESEKYIAETVSTGGNDASIRIKHEKNGEVILNKQIGFREAGFYPGVYADDLRVWYNRYEWHIFVTKDMVINGTEYAEGTEFAHWGYESTVENTYEVGNSVVTYLDYPMDFPLDYSSNILGQTVNNTNFIESNFRMRIYGACENPEVVIAGHSYQVNVSVEANEFLTIDSVLKTIVLTKRDGSTENCFNYRNKDSYIFEKIPSDTSNISSGNFNFEITLLEERSEPKWT